MVWSLKFTREKRVVGARMMDGYTGVERGFGEDVDIDVGIGVFLPMVGFVDTSTRCWRVSSRKTFAF